jgi:hypothetical protein
MILVTDPQTKKNATDEFAHAQPVGLTNQYSYFPRRTPVAIFSHLESRSDCLIKQGADGGLASDLKSKERSAHATIPTTTLISPDGLSSPERRFILVGFMAGDLEG